MGREIRLFDELEIWAHKHAIHFTVALILTGLIISAKSLPGPLGDFFEWLAYVLGTLASYLIKALGFSPLEQGYSAYSLGVQVARIVHRLAGIGMAVIGLVWFLGELPRAKKWQIWPEGSLRTAVKNLIDYYIGKKKPRFGKYNIGQKLWIIGVAIGFTLLFVTGIIMWFRDNFSSELVNAAHILHTWLAWIGIAGLIVHVYLAIGIPEHRPMIRAIFRTGTAPEEFVKEHHPLYYEKISKVSSED